jgi:hypothetical protein
MDRKQFEAGIRKLTKNERVVSALLKGFDTKNFIPAASIKAGWLQDGKTPVVVFEVVSGKVAHPVFILEPKLGVEMFAWKMTLCGCDAQRVYVVAVSDIVSHRYVSTLVARDAQRTSTPATPNCAPRWTAASRRCWRVARPISGPTA